MTPKFLADVVAMVHGFWAIVVVIGPVLSFYHPSFRWVHLFMMAFTISLMLLGKYCPLTLLEHQLRKKHDPSGRYEGGFIVNVLRDRFGVQMSLRTFFILFVAWLVVWTTAYITIWPDK